MRLGSPAMSAARHWMRARRKLIWPAMSGRNYWLIWQRSAHRVFA
jgi:hypothetical protein